MTSIFSGINNNIPGLLQEMYLPPDQQIAEGWRIQDGGLLRTNGPLVDLYRANSARAGRPLLDPTPANRVMVSTDMGNVSRRVPSIHPLVAVAPPDVALHTAEFAEWAVKPDANRAVVESATAMAQTAVDVWTRPDVLRDIRDAFSPGP